MELRATIKTTFVHVECEFWTSKSRLFLSGPVLHCYNRQDRASQQRCFLEVHWDRNEVFMYDLQDIFR